MSKVKAAGITEQIFEQHAKQNIYFDVTEKK
jgi:predicted secreted Zn-dependent protease